jgi:hypothetical protein
MAGQPNIKIAAIEEANPISAIYKSLNEALSNPLSHGSYRIELTFRDSRVNRYVTTWEQSFQVK